MNDAELAHQMWLEADHFLAVAEEMHELLEGREAEMRATVAQTICAWPAFDAMRATVESARIWAEKCRLLRSELAHIANDAEETESKAS